MRDLCRYLTLLSEWNRRINLTALPLDPIEDRSIDRLLIEPLSAVPLVRETDRVFVDVGSGGGSPALPLRLGLGRTRSVELDLIESRSRKAAFLREAVRHLSLTHATVRAERLEVIAPQLPKADVVTVRAVKLDDGLSRVVRDLLSPDGHLVFFGGESEASELQREHFRLQSTVRSCGTIFDLHLR